MVRFLLENGVITETQPPDPSFLEFAAYRRDPEIVKLLLAHGANLLTEESPGINLNPLVNAAIYENYPVAQLPRDAIDQEELIKFRGQDQESLLLVAAVCGWDEMVQQILDQGCLVDTRGGAPEISNLHRKNLPAISFAAGRGHYSTVELLLSYNASYDPPSKYEEPFPLLHAVASGYLNIVDLLLNHGAEPNGIERWYYEEKEIGDLPCIYFAVTYPEIFRLLLDRGADLSLPAAKAKKGLNGILRTIIENVSDDAGRPVTAPTSTFVIQKALESGSTETVQILLEKGMSLQTTSQAGCWSCKPLLVATVTGGETMTRLVLDHVLDVSPGSPEAVEAIGIAIGKACFPLFKLLLDRGLLNPQSATPGSRNILGMTIPTSPAPQTNTNPGATTLNLPTEHTYSEPSNSPLAKSPFEHVIEVGVKSGPENTDIFVQFLLEQGADPLAGSASMGPLYMAARRKYHNIVCLMLRVIDRQAITDHEFELKFTMVHFMPESDRTGGQLATYYAKRSRILYRH